MEMWIAKNVHFLERFRNFDRYKRLIPASLISAVLIISITSIGSSPLTPQSDSSCSSNSFEIYIEAAMMYNSTVHGPITYNGLQVMNVTADVAELSNMSLVRYFDGAMLEMKMPSANATKLMLYAQYVSLFGGGIVYNATWLYSENRFIHIELPPMLQRDVYMKAVYQETESFSATGLNLTLT